MGTGTEYRAAHMAENCVKERTWQRQRISPTTPAIDAARTRTSSKVLRRLVTGARSSASTSTGSRATRLLCKGCTDEYKKLAAKHDGEFQQFMSDTKEQ